MSGEEAPLLLTLFGPLSCQVGGKPLPRLRTKKGYLLLALLVLRAGTPVTRDYLIGNLWPESDDATGASSLRRSLTDLRNALGDEAKRIIADGYHSLKWDGDGMTLDVRAFDAATAKWEKTGDIAAAQEAITLYRGSLLEGLDAFFLEGERAAREQTCLTLVEAVASHALTNGDPERAALLARRAEMIDPLRQSTQRLLYQALVLQGDRPAAERAFREFRVRLRRETGQEPDAELRAVVSKETADSRQQTAVGDAQSPNHPITQHPSELTTDHRPPTTTFLPCPLTNLIGREQDIKDAAVSLRLSRLVTLVGAGGVGKTRLAIAIAGEVANDFAQGVYFVDLSPLSAPAFVPQTVASVLKVLETPGQSLTDALVQFLRERRLLIVLDNCEHLIPACAALTNTLLSGCPPLRILATSRQPLGLTGEVIRRVPSLSLPEPEETASEEKDAALLLDYEAVRLFVARAQEVSPQFRLHAGNCRAVVNICRRLSGIPLAIELAAVRVRSLPVERIAERLNDRFDLLEGGSAGVLPRHKTLRATLDWSYDLLSPEEQTLLRRLSVFAGGCTLEAAEAVCADDTI